MADSALDFLIDENPAGGRQPQGEDRGSSVPGAASRERIKIIGVGGGGNNALDHIIRMGATGVEFLAINTDSHCLDNCLSVEKLILGEKLTRGLGAGARPEVGEMAAVESREEIRSCLKGCDMVYLAAGMGGGTGTGALPVIAEIAKDMGILTVSVVTRPFAFEGKRRKAFAEEGIAKLRKAVDALIVVPNDRLLHLSERTTSLAEAFAMADDVLRQAVQGVTDLVTKPGVVNVDFADLRNIMRHAGGAVMGIGRGSGEHRASDALKRAMECPLMESSVHGAKGVILNVTASMSIGIAEVQDAAERLSNLVDPDATFNWGLVYDEEMGEDIQMVVIATGYDMDSPEAKRGATRGPEVGSVLSETLIDIDTLIDTPSYLRKKEKR
ncbi:MAG: cell division protein FtsZ [Synergistaceae bacterium]|nr:cell division protein FtsZ [Synergistaceae bacterium]